MVLNRDLVKFLDKKRRSDNLKDQIDIPDVFDTMLPIIYDKYIELLEIRDNVEEFNMYIASGVKTVDDTFYNNYFLPSCILFIYQLWLNQDLDFKEMCNDLFTLGTGCVNDDLIPEVTGICEKCSDNFVRFKSSPATDIRQINSTVFRKQINHNFSNPKSVGGLCDATWTDEVEADISTDTFVNPFDEQIGDQIVSPQTVVSTLTNPFAVFSSESESEELFLDSCDVCFESFPSEDFVKLHKTIFHSTSPVVVKTKFVENPEAFITSFVSSSPLLESEDVTAPADCHGHVTAAKKQKYTLRKRPKH